MTVNSAMDTGQEARRRSGHESSPMRTASGRKERIRRAPSRRSSKGPRVGWSDVSSSSPRSIVAISAISWSRCRSLRRSLLSLLDRSFSVFEAELEDLTRDPIGEPCAAKGAKLFFKGPLAPPEGAEAARADENEGAQSLIVGSRSSEELFDERASHAFFEKIPFDGSSALTLRAKTLDAPLGILAIVDDA